jgi:hypothetical protein
MYFELFFSVIQPHANTRNVVVPLAFEEIMLCCVMRSVLDDYTSSRVLLAMISRNEEEHHKNMRALYGNARNMASR